MTAFASIVRPMLEALRNAGGHDEADAFETEFNARGWHLDASDQVKVLASLQAALARPTAPQAPTPRPSTAPATVPERFSAFSCFSPWVRRLPSKWSFVEAVHGLLDADTFGELADAVRGVFVDHLGYELSDLDETHRVSTQQTITRVRSVARHDDFFVVVVESKYAGPHLSSFEPVFQLHPRAIVFALECGERIRVVARRVDSGQRRMTGQRVLRGRGRRAFPDDDLFVWCGRMHQLEPHVGDDGRRIARRADEAVRRTSRQIVDAWPSAPVQPDSIPGAPWEEAVAEELSRFFQPSRENRIVFGLEAEFRSCFPWSTRNGDASLRYRGYTVAEIERDAWSAQVHGTTLNAELTLSLELVRDGQAPQPLTVRCVVSVPDDGGTFVLRGYPRAFCPRLGAGLGRKHDDGFSEDEAELELLPEEDPDELADGADLASTAANAEELEKDPPAEVYANEGLVPLLRWVVGRKLRMLGVTFSNTPPERLDSSQAVLAWLGRYTDPRERLQLVARSVLSPYLRQPCRSHRPIGIDADIPPPAWACLELAGHLEPGRAVPASGARVGPGGVMAAALPEQKGHIVLSSVEREHPRLAATTDPKLRPLWVNANLSAFANVQAGALARPLDLLASGVRLRLRAFASSGDPEALLVPKSRLPKTHASRPWTFDVPRHLGAAERITLDVGPGQTVREGDLLAHVSSGWADATSERHDLVRVGRVLQDRSTKAPARDRRRTEIRCPPGLAGLVESIEVTTINGLRGRPGRTRLALVVSHRVTFAEAVLPDGRLVPLRDVPAEDLPFHTVDGTAAEAALDPLEGSPDAEGEDGSLWRCGRDSELVAGSVSDLDVWLLPTPQRRLPDPCVPARVLDGWGLPRSTHDPQLSVGELRRLLVRRPEQADAVFSRLRAWNGSSWAATSLFDLTRACHLPPPPSAPADWALEEDDQSPEDYDPLRTRIHTASAAPYRVEMGPWAWSCDCGALSKARYAQLVCAECGTSVKRRWVGLPHRSQPFPLPILHPWRIELTAGLLGLTEDELQQLARTEDCSPLYAATDAALEDPTRSLTRRLLDADLAIAPTLQRQLQLVEDAVQRGVRLGDLWIDELTLLSPRLLFDGYRTGSPDLTASPLTTRYRKIEGLTRFEAGEPGSPMRRATWVELQKAVGDLFGQATGTPEPGTLASLWTRLWPTTCDPSIPVVVPGLFEHADGRDLRGSLVATLMRSDVKADEPRRRLGLLGPDKVEPLDVPSLPRPDLGSPRAWKERAALAECWDTHLRHLAALCLGIDEKPSIVAGLRGIDGAAELEDAGSVGMVVLRELFRALSRPEASPAALLALLTAQPPLALPRARDEALAKIDARLREAVPGDAFAARLVREALGRALSGFWSGPPTPEHPDRWIWTQLADSAPPGFRRTVPKLGSSGWLVWPGVKMLCAPILAALEGWESGRTAAHAAWLGLEVPELPAEAPLESPPAVKDTESPAVHAPVVTQPPEIMEPTRVEPEPAAEAGALVRVLDTTLDAWMKRQHRSHAHAE